MEDTDEIIEVLAIDLCNTYYLTVDLNRPMINAFDKISEVTRRHWRAQASLLIRMGWRHVDLHDLK